MTKKARTSADFASTFTKGLFNPLAHVYGTYRVQRLLGFYVMWHVYGGREGMEAAGFGKSTIRNQKAEFYRVFEVTVDQAWPDVAVELRREGTPDAAFE